MITIYREFDNDHEVVIACTPDNKSKSIRQLIFEALQGLLEFENYFPLIVKELLSNNFKLIMQYKSQENFGKTGIKL